MTIRILQGDCREVLKTLPDCSVHMVCTSPPYLGLREYGTATWEGGDPACDHVIGAIRTGLGMAALGEQYRGGGKKAAEPKPLYAKAECPKCGALRFDQQIGLEETPAEYVAALVAVFREVKRVLRPDGVCWVNLGDAYGRGERVKWVGDAQRGTGFHNAITEANGYGDGAILPNKQLLMIPARVALALQDDGWILRSDVIWHKPNPMPESITDRPTSSHEHVFLLAKSGSATFWTHRERAGTRAQPAPDYRWVHRETGEEIAVDPGEDDKRWRRVNLWRGNDYFFDAEAVREPGEMKPQNRFTDGRGPKTEGYAAHRRATGMTSCGTRNIRNVWTITTTPFPEAHFATFPAELAERCIKAGTSERGCCPSCAAPYGRLIERVDTGRKQKMTDGWEVDPGAHGTIHRKGRIKGESGVPVLANVTVGWAPSCQCDAGDPVPCTVLDPFAGAFTAPLVADRLQRHAIGIELNRAYCEMAKRRIERDAGLFADLAAD